MKRIGESKHLAVIASRPHRAEHQVAHANAIEGDRVGRLSVCGPAPPRGGTRAAFSRPTLSGSALVRDESVHLVPGGVANWHLAAVWAFLSRRLVLRGGDPWGSGWLTGARHVRAANNETIGSVDFDGDFDAPAATTGWGDKREGRVDARASETPRPEDKEDEGATGRTAAVGGAGDGAGVWDSGGWGDWADADGDAAEHTLPRPTETVDEDGTITRVSHRIRADGTKVKVTQKIRRGRRVMRVTAAMKRRRTWRKFGQAASADNQAVTFIGDDVFLEKPGDEGNEDGVFKKSSARVSGRNSFWRRKAAMAEGAERGKVGKAGGGADGTSGTGGKGGMYRPPGARGATSLAGRRSEGHDNSTTLFVTNLSLGAVEADVHELFRPFGRIERVHVARREKTEEPRGFAFVTYARREDAELARSRMDRYGYDHLVLSVKFSKPKPNREHMDTGGGNGMRHASGYGKALPQTKQSFR